MFKKLLPLAAILTISSSCTIKPGDYRVYRLAVHGTSLGCQYKNPDDYTQDNYFDPRIVAIYAADNNTFFLEDNADAFVGSRSGKDFTFVGDWQHSARYDEDEGFSRNFEIAETQKTTYTLTVNNKEIFGNLVLDYTSGCSGSEDDCEIVGVYDRVCTDVFEVFGSEVDDTDIDYLLAGPGPGGGAEGDGGGG